METFDREAVQSLPMLAVLSWPTFEKVSSVFTRHAVVCVSSTELFLGPRLQPYVLVKILPNLKLV